MALFTAPEMQKQSATGNPVGDPHFRELRESLSFLRVGRRIKGGGSSMGVGG